MYHFPHSPEIQTIRPQVHFRLVGGLCIINKGVQCVLGIRTVLSDYELLVAADVESLVRPCA